MSPVSSTACSLRLVFSPTLRSPFIHLMIDSILKRRASCEHLDSVRPVSGYQGRYTEAL